MHLLMCVQFQSRDKDAGYTIQSAVSENPMLQANITAQCLTEREYCRSKFYIVGIGFFYLFGSCDLELDPMTFVYELDP